MRLVLLVCLVGCGRLRFAEVERTTDGNAPDVDAAVLPLFGPFDPPVEQTALNSTVREFGTTISADGKEIYVSSYRAGGAGGCDIYRGTYSEERGEFGGLAAVPGTASTDDDGEPSLSSDGLTMYFQRYMPTTTLFQSTRSAPDATDWSVAIPIESPGGNLVGFEGVDFGPDDLRLVLAKDDELYESVRPTTSSPWGAPQLLAGLGGTASDGFPALRSDGLEIFWESNRSPPLAVYRALRPSVEEPFGPPERVSLGALDAAPVGDPDISADGRVLVIVASAGGTGEFDVYITQRAPL